MSDASQFAVSLANLMGHWLVIILATVFGAAFLAPWVHRRLPAACGLVLSLVPLGALAVFTAMIPYLRGHGPIRFRHDWVPSLGISLDFYVDGLSLMFLVLISGIGAFVTWYASGYLAGKKDLGRFYLYLFGFMGAMLGVVSADHLVLLFIFWELTSISSYLLIGYYHNEAKSRAAALQALLVTGAGGLCLLAGVILLGRLAGTYRISELLQMDPTLLVEAPGFATITVLVLLGAFTKSAQFPFHFWLPNAMAAPAPVSAYLHSATMVKAGVFLLARLHPLLSVGPLWFPVVAPVGAITMVTGVVMAMGQSDLKKILAYTTLAVLGTLTMLLGIGTEAAVKAAMAYLLAHALYKAALFMTSGAVDHETGTREVDELGGLRHLMPYTAAAAAVAGLSMAGVPLLFGFVSKEYFYKALLAAGQPEVLWETLGVGASVVMVALAVTTAWKPFWGALKPTPKQAHEAPWTMWLGPVLLGVASLKTGLLPGVASFHLLEPAVHAVLGNQIVDVHLKLWHGWTLALALSGLTLVLGVALYFQLPRARLFRPLGEKLASFGPERGYDKILSGVLAFGRWQTDVLQNGYLRNYILTIVIFTAALICWALAESLPELVWPAMGQPDVLTVTVCLLMIAGSIFACITQSRFNAILALGVVGLGVAMIYFLFSAPDLAMTQVLVETLTLVLFVLAFYRLPLFGKYSKPATRWRDAVLALVFGTVMAFVVLAEQAGKHTNYEVSRFYGDNSLLEAQGRNVVNVILVDFRALDTLGEISVLAIAALGVVAMLKMRPRGRRQEDQS